MGLEKIVKTNKEIQLGEPTNNVYLLLEFNIYQFIKKGLMSALIYHIWRSHFVWEVYKKERSTTVYFSEVDRDC